MLEDAWVTLGAYMLLAPRKHVIVFDVNETLLDICALEPLFARLFGDVRVMRQWFGELVLYSEALTLSGRYIDFAELGEAVLRMLAERADAAPEGCTQKSEGYVLSGAVHERPGAAPVARTTIGRARSSESSPQDPLEPA
jgi:hypothetical protein